MVQRHRLALAGHGRHVHQRRTLTAGGHHHAPGPVGQRLRAGRAQPGCQHAIGGGRRPAALHVAQDCQAGFQVASATPGGV